MQAPTLKGIPMPACPVILSLTPLSASVRAASSRPGRPCLDSNSESPSATRPGVGQNTGSGRAAGSGSGSAQPAVSTGTPKYTIQVIGGLRIVVDGRVLESRRLGGSKPRQILEILLLSRGAPVSKDRLIELLWGDRAPAGALPTLESYVSLLRRTLQPGLGRGGLLKTVNGGYQIDRLLLDLDLDRFDSLVTQARDAMPLTAYALLTEALALATGPILGDELVPVWVEAERARFTAALFEAKVRVAQSALRIDQVDESIRWSEKAVALNPLGESGWTALALAFERAGRHAEALRAYDRCRVTLSRELGCAPGPELRAIYARLLRQTADGTGDLSDALSAVLVLNEHLGRSGTSPAEDGSVALARDVLFSFVRRALEAA